MSADFTVTERFLNGFVFWTETPSARQSAMKTSCAIRSFLSSFLLSMILSCRLVVRLFQQVRHSHDIAILLQHCVVNVVTLLLYQGCIRLEFEFEFEFIKFGNITFTNKYTQINKIKIKKNYIWRGNPKKKPKGL